MADEFVELIQLLSELIDTSIGVKEFMKQEEEEEKHPSKYSKEALRKIKSQIKASFTTTKKDIQEFVKLYDHWRKGREKTAAALEKLAANMDTHRFNSNIANITGSTVTVAATVSLFVPGIGPGLAAIIGAVAICGGLTSIGASVADYSLMSFLNKEAEGIIREDKNESRKMMNLVEKINDQLLHIMRQSAKLDGMSRSENIRVTTQVLDGTGELYHGYHAGKELRKLLRSTFRQGGHAAELGLGAQSAARLGRRGAFALTAPGMSSGAGAARAGRGAAKIAGRAATVAFVLMDIWNIVECSKDMSQGSRPDQAEDCRTVAEDIRERMEFVGKLKKAYQSL